jgi:hypothetical protein
MPSLRIVICVQNLGSLKGEGLYFLKMCDVSRRATYTYAQETKLVRIVIDHIGPDYKHCILYSEGVRHGKGAKTYSEFAGSWNFGHQSTMYLTLMKGHSLMIGCLPGSCCKRA